MTSTNDEREALQTEQVAKAIYDVGCTFDEKWEYAHPRTRMTFLEKAKAAMAAMSSLPAPDPAAGACTICGEPKHRHSGGYPNTCPIVPTYRAPAVLAPIPPGETFASTLEAIQERGELVKAGIEPASDPCRLAPAAGEAVAQLLAWADRALPMTDDASDFLNEGGWEQFGNIIARFRMSQMPEPLWQQGKGPVILEAQATEPSQRPRESHGHFLDGMKAAAEICGSLAETTYDDADQFEAATGCEAAIMECVREGRAKQAAPPAPATGGEGLGELIAMLSAATPNELGGGTFDHSPEEIGTHVMEHYRAILAALANHSPDAGGVGEDDVETVAAAFAKVFYGPGFDAFHNPEAFDLVMTAMSAALRPDPRGEG